MSIGSTYSRPLLRGLWHAIRLPALALLVILQPVVSFVFAGLALLGVLTTIFFALVGPPHFPAWTMLCISLGFFFALVIYEGAIRLLSA
jgi:hypothetical protein